VRESNRDRFYVGSIFEVLIVCLDIGLMHVPGDNAVQFDVV